MMLKKNNKPVLKDLPIPITSDLAANIHDKQKAEQAEHEEMKRLVLDYTRPTKRGAQIRPFAANNKTPKGAPVSRLRTRDTEQQFFSSSTRLTTNLLNVVFFVFLILQCYFIVKLKNFSLTIYVISTKFVWIRTSYIVSLSYMKQTKTVENRIMMTR